MALSKRFENITILTMYTIGPMSGNNLLFSQSAARSHVSVNLQYVYIAACVTYPCVRTIIMFPCVLYITRRIGQTVTVQNNVDLIGQI